MTRVGRLRDHVPTSGEDFHTVVRGVLAGESQLRPWDPGEVPSARPPESFWGDRYFELPDFVPPRIDPRGETGIPHLGLDAVLAELLGDVL